MKVTGHNGMASLFMGAVMTATSVGITARILKELDFLSADVSRIIIGAAVIDDILGLMILSAISSIQLNGGVQTASLLTSAIVIFIFVFVFTVGGAAAAKKFGNKISALNMRNAPLIVAVVVCFIYSIIANETGLAAIVGAFMAGMVFSGTKPGIEAQGKVEFINDLVSVFFFVIMGTKVDPHFFLERGIIIPGLIFTVLAFVGKFAGCGLPVLNYGIKKASFIGLAMVPRGEVGIIIAAFALGRGIIGEGLYAMAVFMVLFTSLIPPLFMEPMIKGIKKAG
jgi:Kef-type K+ transport system membrane component KefB